MHNYDIYNKCNLKKVNTNLTFYKEIKDLFIRKFVIVDSKARLIHYLELYLAYNTDTKITRPKDL